MEVISNRKMCVGKGFELEFTVIIKDNV